MFADKIGGLAVPSVGITRVNTEAEEFGLESFGAISLIADKQLIEGKGARTFDTDIYSPRYPTVRFKINRNVFNQEMDKLNAVLKDKYNTRGWQIEEFEGIQLEAILHF